MAAKKVTVVISQSPGKNPLKRDLEETIAATLLLEPAIDVSLVPHLYDLTSDHTGMLFLKSVRGDMVVLSWLFPRAARWILDRNSVKGHAGVSLLKSPHGEDEDDEVENLENEEDQQPPEDRPNALGGYDLPDRKIYCLDLRDHADANVYLDEIRRIARETSVQTVELMGWINGSPAPEQLARYLNPVDFSLNGAGAARPEAAAPAPDAANPAETTRRRWYPVIDYSRCTNCMECIDFCLFGVYGVDSVDRILVEQQDNCKKGCPACSRVCPENAIIFPEHKTPAIAGSETGTAAGLKIDLSKLFGAPSALEQAVLERDTELVADGRDAVGMSVGVPKRRPSQPQPRDALDDLMDGLDKLEL